MFEKKNIRRAPVVRDGKLAGIVTRADMVKALMQCWSAAHPRPRSTTPRFASRSSTSADGALERHRDAQRRGARRRVDLYGVAIPRTSPRRSSVLAEFDAGREERAQPHADALCGPAAERDLGRRPSSLHPRVSWLEARRRSCAEHLAIGSLFGTLRCTRISRRCGIGPPAAPCQGARAFAPGLDA